MPRAGTKINFGKYKGKQVAKLPSYYLAWIAGYSGIGYSSITLPREQVQSYKDSIRCKMPVIYYPAIKELVRRNKCLVCMNPLVSFRINQDWDTRLLHKKCYQQHIDDILELLGRK